MAERAPATLDEIRYICEETLRKIDEFFKALASQEVAPQEPAGIQCEVCARFGRIMKNCPLCHGQGG